MRRVLSLRYVLLIFVFGCTVTASAQEIWLTRLEDLRGLFESSSSILKPGAVAVFKLSTQYVLHTPEPELRLVFDVVRRNHLKLAVEGLMLEGVRSNCGHGVEGYSASGTMRLMAERIRDLGGELDAVAMDEPLWFGSHYHGKQNCLDPITVVAQQLAGSVRDILKVFPKARIGDIEPIVDAKDTEWALLLTAWPDAYEKGVGRRLDFLHADVDWDRRWEASLQSAQHMLFKAGLPLGIIYTGDPNTPTAAEWTASAENHFGLVEDELGIAPQHVIFQSWAPQVTHLLPKSEPGTLLWLLDRYELPHAKLTASMRQNQIEGDLRDAHGVPQPHRQIQLLAEGGVPASPTTVHLAGQVPADAHQALLAVRLNTECICDADAQLVLSTATYRERMSGRKITPPLPRAPNSATPSRFRVSRATKMTANGSPFAVTPAAFFDLDLGIESSAGADSAGFLAIIFLDAAGKEVRRVTFLPGHERREVSSAVTDAQGHFLLRPNLTSARKWIITAPADVDHRATMLVLRDAPMAPP